MTLLNCDLSFDPRDPYHPVPGDPSITWAIQVFTTENGYGVDPSSAQALSATDDDTHVRFTRLARLGQQAAAGSAVVDVRIRRSGGGWAFDIEVAHPDATVKSVKLIFRGLPSAGGWWSPSSARGGRATGPFQWNYPGSDWATPWASNDRAAVSVRANGVGAIALHLATPAYGREEELEVVYGAPATERSHRLRVPPIVLTASGDGSGVAADLEAHVAHVTSTFGLRDWEDRSDLPSWARDLTAVVTLHGQHWTGHVFNTFDEMRHILDRVAERVDPGGVLAYLPGWEGRYYYEYPAYRPGQDLGGSAGFSALAQHARELGVRLMPMFGANGANVTQYPAWRDAAIRNDTDRYPTMLNSPDWDGDRFPEGDQVFLNPGEPGFQAHLAASISAVVEEYGVDAAFLDTAGFWFNDPRHALLDGYRALGATLRARHPELLLVSEGWWDALLGVFPVSQQWLGISRDIERPDFLTRFARTTSHLAEGTPGLGSTGVHEQGYRVRPADQPLPGHLPVVSFAGDTTAQHFELLERLAGRPTRVTTA